MRTRILLVLLAALGCHDLAFAQPSAQRQPSSQTVGNSVQEVQAAAQRAEDAARAAVAAKGEAERQRDETLKRLDATSTEMIGRATFLQTIATTTIGFVAFAVTVAGVLGSVAAVMGGFSLGQSLKKVKQGEATATAAAAKIEEMKEGIEKHKLFLNNLQQQVTQALTDIESKLQAALTPGTGLIGVNLVSAVPQRSYDDDALIVFSDRLRITGEDLKPERLATFLVMLGNYWRRTKEYGRAIERIRRAIELDPSSAAAHKALGRAIWNQVAEELAATETAISPSQTAVLTDAEAALERAQELLARSGQQDEEIPFDLGTISRLKGEIPQAIDQYRRGARLSKDLARIQHREPDWDFEFALACLYAKTGQYQQAMDELGGVIGKTQSWSQERRRIENRDYREWTRSDPDFSGMFADDTWRVQLTALLAAP